MIAVVAATFAATVYGDADALAGRAIESVEQGSLLATLPAVTWGQDSGWRWRMARADDLAADIAACRDPVPACTAEVVALYRVLAAAAGTGRPVTWIWWWSIFRRTGGTATGALGRICCAVIVECCPCPRGADRRRCGGGSGVVVRAVRCEPVS